MAWKYIMVRNIIGSTELAFPIIFPDKMVHRDVFDHTKMIMPGWKHQGIQIMSAGTIEAVATSGLGGDSETLRIKSQPKRDTSIIAGYSYLHGFIR